MEPEIPSAVSGFLPIAIEAGWELFRPSPPEATTLGAGGFRTLVSISPEQLNIISGRANPELDEPWTLDIGALELYLNATFFQALHQQKVLWYRPPEGTRILFNTGLCDIEGHHIFLVFSRISQPWKLASVFNALELADPKNASSAFGCIPVQGQPPVVDYLERISRPQEVIYDVLRPVTLVVDDIVGSTSVEQANFHSILPFPFNKLDTIELKQRITKGMEKTLRKLRTDFRSAVLGWSIADRRVVFFLPMFLGTHPKWRFPGVQCAAVMAYSHERGRYEIRSAMSTFHALVSARLLGKVVHPWLLESIKSLSLAHLQESRRPEKRFQPATPLSNAVLPTFPPDSHLQRALQHKMPAAPPVAPNMEALYLKESVGALRHTSPPLPPHTTQPRGHTPAPPGGGMERGSSISGAWPPTADTFVPRGMLSVAETLRSSAQDPLGRNGPSQEVKDWFNPSTFAMDRSHGHQPRVATPPLAALRSRSYNEKHSKSRGLDPFGLRTFAAPSSPQLDRKESSSGFAMGQPFPREDPSLWGEIPSSTAPTPATSSRPPFGIISSLSAGQANGPWG